jgi:hypothetical protein
MNKYSAMKYSKLKNRLMEYYVTAEEIAKTIIYSEAAVTAFCFP